MGEALGGTVESRRFLLRLRRRTKPCTDTGKTGGTRDGTHEVGALGSVVE